MPFNWQTVIETLIATVGGGGVMLAAVAWLIKTLVSNRLALDTESDRGNKSRLRRIPEWAAVYSFVARAEV